MSLVVHFNGCNQPIAGMR